MKLQKEQYLHYRFVENDKSVNPFGGYTVCYIPSGGKCVLGISKCSLNDNFSKKKGRSISRNRAVNSSSNKRRKDIHFEYDHLLSYEDIDIIASDIIINDIHVQSERHGYDYDNAHIRLTSCTKK